MNFIYLQLKWTVSLLKVLAKKLYFILFTNSKTRNWKFVKLRISEPSTRLSRCEVHLLNVLVIKEAFTQCSIESLNYCLFSVNVDISSSYSKAMLFHLFSDITHEFMSRIKLKNLRSFKRASPINCLKSLWNLRRIFRSQRSIRFESTAISTTVNVYL